MFCGRRERERESYWYGAGEAQFVDFCAEGEGKG